MLGLEGCSLLKSVVVRHLTHAALSRSFLLFLELQSRDVDGRILLGPVGGHWGTMEELVVI